MMTVPASILKILTASSLFATISANGSWTPNWSATSERILDKAFEIDPNDDRCMMRGSGQITLGNGIAKFKGSPRLYISQEDGMDGWENVEITAYGKYVDQGTAPYKNYSGLTLATRSNHDNNMADPCGGFAYYARIYQETGQCAFQKQYYHSATTGTVYTNSKRVDCFPSGLPLGQWVGMKYKVTTEPGTSNVLLELSLDENDDGNWQLRHSVTDTEGSWFSGSSTNIPCECPQNDGDTVLRPGNVSFLRTDGVDDTTEVHWRNVTMINSLSSTDPDETRKTRRTQSTKAHKCPSA